MFLVMCDTSGGCSYPECVIVTTAEFGAWKLQRIHTRRRFERIVKNTRTCLRISHGEGWLQYTLEYVKPWSLGPTALENDDLRNHE